MVIEPNSYLRFYFCLGHILNLKVLAVGFEF